MFCAVELFAFSCAGDTSAPSGGGGQDVVVRISLNTGSQTLTSVGETATLTATAFGKLGAINNPSLTWSSDAPSVVDVQGSGTTGTATARGAGTAHVTASSGAATATATITVTLPAVASVAIAERAVELTVGATKTLTAMARQANGGSLPDRPVTWSAIDPGIASVTSAGGVVTAVSVGTGRVVATCEGKADTAVVTVTPVPSISISTTTLTYGAAQGGANPASQVVTITNGGGGTLSGLSLGTITYGPGATDWLGTPTLSGAAASPSATLTVQPTTGSLAAGTYAATIPVLSSVASNSPQSITVTFTVAPPVPGIALSSATLSFSATQGGSNPTGQVITITNAVAGTLNGLSLGAITYGPGATGWLAPPSLSSGTANPSATFTVQPLVGTLGVGTFSATIPVLSTEAANSPQTVTVTFTIAAAPSIIALSASNLNFGAPPGGANPPSQTVVITNGGGGTLSGLSVGTISYGPGATGWLTQASLNSATATPSATLTVQPATGSLAAGTYTATIPIVSANAGNSPRAVTVTFTLASGSFTITLTAEPPEGGTVNGGGTFPANGPVTATATPEDGYVFTNWTEGGTVAATSQTYAFAATANRALVAHFLPAPCTITVSAFPPDAGTVSGGGDYACGTTVTVTATPTGTHGFDSWSFGGQAVSSSTSLTFVAVSSTSLVANFTTPGGPYTISARPSPTEGGTVTGSGVYAANANVTLTATPAAGYAFNAWRDASGAPLSTSTTYTFAATQNAILFGSFTPTNAAARRTAPPPPWSTAGKPKLRIVKRP